MDVSEAVAAVSVVFAAAMMICAATEDHRRREVRDIYWILIGMGGSVLYVAQILAAGEVRWECLAGTVLSVSSFALVMWAGKTEAVLLVTVMAVDYVVLVLFGELSSSVPSMMAVPAFSLVYVLAYVSGIVRGGADCKCLVAISVAFPAYPEFLGFPMIDGNAVLAHIFVPSVSVLFLGALSAAAAYALYLIYRNHGTEEGMKGFRMDISAAREAFVWPLEDSVDGRAVRIEIPSDDEVPEIYARLESSGMKDVLVTPQIPFIVPMAAAFVFVMVVGSPLLV